MPIRPALPSDYPAFAHLFPELQVPMGAPGPARWEAEMVARTVVAEEDGAVVGYLFTRLLVGSGHVSQIVVAPGARGRGVGRALMAAAAAGFRSEGLPRWGLNVREDNTSARHLYTAVGLSPIFGSVVLRFDDWSRIDALPRAPGVLDVVLAPEDEAAAEADTGVIPGQLVEARGRSSRVVRALRSSPDGRFLGAAVFDPDFGGASPFRVADPTLAGALLRALRPHRNADVPFLEVKVDHDPALVAVLVAAGAEARQRTLHYEGPL